MTTTTILADSSGFNSTPTAIAGFSKLQIVIGYAAWIAVGVLIIIVIGTGASMVVQYHRGEQEALGRLGAAIGGCLVVGGASAIAGTVLGFNLFTSTPEAIPGLTAVQTVIGVVAYIAAAICVIGVIVAGAMLNSAYKQGRPFAHLGSVLAGCVIVGSASTIVGAMV